MFYLRKQRAEVTPKITQSKFYPAKEDLTTSSGTLAILLPRRCVVTSSSTSTVCLASVVHPCPSSCTQTKIA